MRGWLFRRVRDSRQIHVDGAVGPESFKVKGEGQIARKILFTAGRLFLHDDVPNVPAPGNYLVIMKGILPRQLGEGQVSMGQCLLVTDVLNLPDCVADNHHTIHGRHATGQVIAGERTEAPAFSIP